MNDTKWNQFVKDMEKARELSEKMGVPVVIKQEGEYIYTIDENGEKVFYKKVMKS